MVPIPLYKIVIRNRHGHVIQIHEWYTSDQSIIDLIEEETKKGNSITITKL